MTLFCVSTNFPVGDNFKEILENVSGIVAKYYGNIEDVCGSLADDCRMIYAGSGDKFLHVLISTICDLTDDRNETCAVSLTDYMSREFGVTTDRILINFDQRVVSDVAINGSTLHYLA